MSRLLRVELSGCWLDKYGITREQFADLSERLKPLGTKTALTDVALLATGDVPPEKAAVGWSSLLSLARAIAK